MSMARDLARCLDPVLMAVDCKIVPDLWQATLLRDRPRRALLCCSRQAGKSTTTALLALWVALFEAPALILLVSPSQRQSAELFRTVMGFYRQLSDTSPLAAESVLRAEFANGSRILSLPGSEKTTRGYSKASLIILDEAARVEDELIASLKPMQATAQGGGQFLALSTPRGRIGWFYETFEHGGPEWTRIRVPASECPRISQEFLDEELKQLGPLAFSEEYQLAFNDASTSAFQSAIVEKAFSAEVRPLWA
jgi:hypothetical protein